MKYIGLVLKSARRSKRRTLLTIMSVAIAVFLFASLRAVLDGFNAAAEASSSTRIVTQRATSLFFSSLACLTENPYLAIARARLMGFSVSARRPSE